MEVGHGIAKFSIGALFSILLSLGTSLTWASDKKINLVTFEEPPYVFAENGERPGIIVKVVSELMKRVGLAYNLTVLPPKRALLLAIQTPNTCVFPIERSQEREVKLRWVSPVMISRNGFFANPKNSIRDIRALNDAKIYRIGSVFGSAIGEYLESLGFNVDFASDSRANIVKLEHGRIDLWASDTLAASYISRRNAYDLDEAQLVFFTTLRALGCNLDVPRQVITDLNEALADMYQEGYFTQFENGY